MTREKYVFFISTPNSLEKGIKSCVNKIEQKKAAPIVNDAAYMEIIIAYSSVWANQKPPIELNCVSPQTSASSTNPSLETPEALML